MKFIVDVMLGKLAKWLRILGYDTLYDSSYNDNELMLKAQAEGRILLTRDSDLVNRMGSEGCLFIEAQNVWKQLLQVTAVLKLDMSKNLFTRCTICNTPVQPIEKLSVKEKVPACIFEVNDDFFQCPDCQRIYWAGSHYENIKKTLQKLEGDSLWLLQRR